MGSAGNRWKSVQWMTLFPRNVSMPYKIIIIILRQKPNEQKAINGTEKFGDKFRFK